MKHYRQEDWADFARGLVSGERESAMKKHLEGCTRCEEAVAIWRSVAEAAGREASYHPPESAVRIAKGYSVPGASEESRPSLATLVAELVSDTSREPALAGVRGVTAAPRQLLYHCDQYSIDLRIEREVGSALLTLTGQILSATGNLARFVPVTVISAMNPLASGRTNDFGEFRMEFEAATQMVLSVWLHSTRILIPLDAVIDKSSPTKGLRGGR